MNTTNKALILDNLERAYTIIERTEPEFFNLSHYRRVTPCGTLHCLAGELTKHNHFRKQGMALKIMGPESCILDIPGGDATSLGGNHKWLDNLFGPEAWYALFDSYGSGIHDSELMQEERLTYSMRGDGEADKVLALARIRHQMAIVNDLP